MLQFENMKFATSIGVLFTLKQTHGHKTLQETYTMLEKTDMDSIFEVLCVSYNVANDTKLNTEEFVALLDTNNVGFLKIIELFKNVVETMMFSGLSEKEIEERKNALTNLKK